MRSLFIAAAALALCAGAAQAQTASAPKANPNAPANSALKNPGDTAKKPGAPAPGANSFTEGQARDRITKAGYTGVGKLTKTKDGLWTGRATKDGKKARVALDYQGNVTAK